MNRRTRKKAIVWLLLAAFIFTLWQMPGDRSEAAAAKSVAGSWKKDSKGWWYKFSDGSGYAKNEYIKGYWLNKKGYWVTKWDGKWHHNAKGWWFQAGSWYPKNQWLRIDRKDYYFDSQGYMVTNRWIGRYYVDKNGVWTKTRNISDKYPTDSPAANWGALQVNGVDLCSESGEKIQLKGVSTFGIIWSEGCENINQEAFKTVQSWGANTIRLAVYTEGGYGGYCETSVPRSTLDQTIENGVAYATNLGMYVIIDWHILSDNNPNKYIEEAKSFFEKYSAKYADYTNVLYEICNEPNGSTTWAEVKSYADTIIPIIRKHDDDAIILVGTPTWSQDVDEASKNPVKEKKNVMYVLHFYAAEHKEWLRTKITTARNAGAPVFISECNICNANGDGSVDYSSASEWKKFIKDNNLSFIGWSLCNKDEKAAFIRHDCSKHSGWTESDLTDTGKYYKNWFGEN
ncbi:MAG: cellulase family glycosylhydrolase [Eubacterium sp.]|nr:cellulase family glycosylhydrolase [Eubacterium sp.]